MVPWAHREQKVSSGSGFVIEGQRILTNAHVVRNAVRMRVQRFGSAEKWPAKVVAISLECDLAVIEISNDIPAERIEAFWEKMPILRFTESGVPNLYDKVSVIGFPTGGHTISVTKGVVSRVDAQVYNRYSSASLLVAQIDAAINPGNSGGPVVNSQGEIVGVAFMKRASVHTDNVGYIIPALVAANFLRKLDGVGSFLGVPELGFEYQSLDNPSLREASGMQSHQSGVLVVDVAPLSAVGPRAPMGIEPNDVILQVDGHPVANDGSVCFRQNELLPLDHLITCKVSGPTHFLILRDGKEVEIAAEMTPVPTPAPRFIPAPEYFIIGGLVFTFLSGPLLEEIMSQSQHGSSSLGLPESVVKMGFATAKQEEDSQVVLLLQILAHEVNYGYGSRNCLVVDAFNGEKILNIRNLVNLVRETTDGFLKFSFRDTNRSIVLDAAKSRDAEDEILEMHGISSPCSYNLRG